MIDCSEAMRQLWEYLDACVDADTRDLLDEHLARCRRCCGELEFTRQLRTYLAQTPRDDLPTDVRERLYATIEALLP